MLSQDMNPSDVFVFGRGSFGQSLTID